MKMGCWCWAYCFIYYYLCYSCANSTVLLFDTDNQENTQAHDCIYFDGGDLDSFINVESTQATKYCVRSNTYVPIDRSYSHGCFNGGILISFDKLKQLNVTTQELLKWNSGVSVVDRYRAYIMNDQLK